MTIAEEQMTFSTLEVSVLTNVSYRQLDYWLRKGYISILEDAEGSGSRRRWTLEEINQLRRVLARCQAAHSVLRDFATGALWERERA